MPVNCDQSTITTSANILPKTIKRSRGEKRALLSEGLGSAQCAVCSVHDVGV